jgi:HK97 family phage major capsid protein
MIAKRIKELTEKRDAKLNEASVLINKAREEKRELSADDLKKIETFQNEAEGFANTLAAEARQLALQSQKPVKLSEREERDIAGFDWNKMLNHMVRSQNGFAPAIDGVEAELIQEGDKEAREAGIGCKGLFLPRLFVRRGVERRDLTATGQTSVAGDQGGMTVATTKSGLLDDFFNASVLRGAGATVLEGLVGNLDLPRLVSGTAPVKKTENEAAGEYTPTTAMLSLSPNRLPAFVDVSEQLLKQSSVAIESILRSHVVNQMVAVQEAAFFHGNGTSEANGILGTTGIGACYAGGASADDTNANGAAPVWADFVNLETAVDTNNALLGNLHYFSNGQVRGKLKQTAKVASTDSRMILEDNGLINGYVPLWTNAISRTLTKGSSNVCSAIVFGNAADYVIGYWGGISLELIRDSVYAKVGQYCLVASAYYDGGVIRPKSFAAMDDVLAA